MQSFHQNQENLAPMLHLVILITSLLFFQTAESASQRVSSESSLQTLSQKSIGIFTYRVPGLEFWDPDQLKYGYGSEESVIFMSQQLANLGYQVFVFCDPLENEKHSRQEANPRFVSLDFEDGSILDIAISWRMPHLAPWLKTRARKVYFWPHDTCSFPVTGQQINDFDDVLWLSQWQRQQWISVNPGFAKFSKIFGNGINLEKFQTPEERVNPHSCIYGSNYARGLEILLDIWPTVKREIPDARLDVYYGWKHWGLLSAEKEVKMRRQIQSLALLDVYEHGRVNQEELNRAYKQASLWTYPCIGLEVFCISAIRAQFAGALPVIIESSALEETVRYGFKCTKKEEYCEMLIQAMRHAEKVTLEDRLEMRAFILEEFTWENIAKKWKQLFDEAI